MTTPDAIPPQTPTPPATPAATTPPNSPSPEAGEKPAALIGGEAPAPEGTGAAPTTEGEKPPPAPETPLALADIQSLIPEGFELDEKFANGALEIFNDDKLSKRDLLNKLVELQVSSSREASERSSSEWNTMIDGWQKQMKELPEIGGANFERNLAAVNRMVDQHGTPEFKTLLRDYGVGNHPEMFRFLAKLAPFVTEPPTIVPGSPPANTPKFTKDNLYG